jgi:hypothetical protein
LCFIKTLQLGITKILLKQAPASGSVEARDGELASGVLEIAGTHDGFDLDPEFGMDGLLVATPIITGPLIPMFQVWGPSHPGDGRIAR